MDALGKAIRASRELPHDIELEQAVLGACLSDNALIDIAQEVLDPEHFFEGLHGRLFQMMGVLRGDGDDVTPTYIHAVMKTDPGLKSFEKNPEDANVRSGLEYLQELARWWDKFTPVRQYATKIKEFAGRRRIIEIATAASDQAHEGLDLYATTAILDGAMDALGDIIAGSKEGARRRPISASDAMHNLGQKIEAQANGTRAHAIQTGIHFIDQYLGGLIPGNILFAGGRPGMGKSQLATNIARNVAMQGMGTDYYCPEMTEDQLAARIACEVDYDRCASEQLDPMPYQDLVLLRAKPEFVERLAFAAMRVREWEAIELFTASMTLEWIEANSRRRARKYPGHRLLVIDHLQLVTVENLRRGANRNEEQTIITKRLKELAKELGWTVLVLSQLSREIESREDKRPRMPDFREGGSIEQDADAVIGLVRLIRYASEKIKGAKSEEQRTVAVGEYDKLIGVLGVAILKNRAGGEADYHDIFIDEKSSAIRNERGGSTMFETELPF